METHEPPPTSDDDGTVARLTAALRKQRWLVLAVTVMVTAGAVVFTLGQKPIYQATATLQIDPSPPSPLGREVQSIVSLGADAFWNNQEYYATQYKILKSRRTALDTVRALGLQRDAGFLANASDGQTPPKRQVSMEAAAATLLSRLTVAPLKDSRLVALTMEDASPERARKLLSALTHAYLQRNVDDWVSSNGVAGQWLREQLTNLKQELEQSELALHDYKKGKRLLSVSLDDQNNMLRDELSQLNQALSEARTRREAVASRVAELDKINADNIDELPVSELLDNTLLGDLRGKYLTAESELSTLLENGKGENHPEVRASRARLDETRDALVAEVRNVQGALRSDLAAVTSEVSGLVELTEAAKQRAMDLNLLEIEFRRLQRTKTNNEKLYSLVLERSKESDLAGMMRFNNIRIVDEPFANKAPVKPRVPLNIGLGVVAGLLLGLLLAFAREHMDRTIRLSDDIEQRFGLSFLGSLPLAAIPGGGKERRGRRRKGVQNFSPELVVHEQPSSSFAEAARSIRTNLMFMSPDTPFRRLLITSPGPGEGKTTVASAVAVALAQTGQRVLLMDCDLRRPRQHRVYGRLNDFGVAQAALDPSLLDDRALETEIPNLSLLPAGPHVPNPAELLQSEAFSALLAKLATDYDRIVLDSPPVAVVSDSTILATRVDGTMLVVRALRTPRETAKKAIRSLRDVAGRIVGVVLNAVDVSQAGYSRYYYAYHSTYYGRGPDEAPTEENDEA